jgi:hypothetical protein
MESLTGSGAVERLWDVEATIHFTDPDSFYYDIHDFFDDAFHRDSLCDHTALVTGFPSEIFDANNDEDEDPLIPRKSKVLYLKSLSFLIITMASLPHEIAALEFGLALDRKLMAMNCDEELVRTGGAKREMENVAKCPDGSWGPVSKGMMTFAIESGLSESQQALDTDAKLWLENSESDVTQVLTIKISRNRPEVLFRLWVQTQQARETRSGNTKRATKAQEVSVVLEEGRPTTEGSLSISFEKLFDRRPQQGTAERDIVLSTRELGKVARLVWIEMKFMPRE